MSAAIDRAVTIAAAVATPVLGLLVDQHVISAVASLDVGAIIAAAVASYHGGKAVQARDTNVASTPAPDPTAPPQGLTVTPVSG